LIGLSLQETRFIFVCIFLYLCLDLISISRLLFHLIAFSFTFLILDSSRLTFLCSIGGNLSFGDYGSTMFSQAGDQANYYYPEDGLLQVYGVVQD